jgi:hypothetical protein
MFRPTREGAVQALESMTHPRLGWRAIDHGLELAKSDGIHF